MANAHLAQSGDVKLIPSIDGARLDFSGGQPLMDQGLETAVYISLFCSDWWGNATLEANEKQASRINDVANSSALSNRMRVSIEIAAEEALGWMISSGVAASVEPSVIITGKSTAELTVSIEQPKAPRVILRYQVNWDYQKDAVSLNRIIRRVPA